MPIQYKNKFINKIDIQCSHTGRYIYVYTLFRNISSYKKNIYSTILAECKKSPNGTWHRGFFPLKVRKWGKGGGQEWTDQLAWTIKYNEGLKYGKCKVCIFLYFLQWRDYLDPLPLLLLRACYVKWIQTVHVYQCHQNILPPFI